MRNPQARIREFLSVEDCGNDFIFREFLFRDGDAMILMEARVAVVMSGPMVLLGGGFLLRNPTDTKLANAIGLHQRSVQAEKICDLVVVGPDPAGARLGKR